MVAFAAASTLLGGGARGRDPCCVCKRQRSRSVAAASARANEPPGLQQATAEYEAELAAVERKYGPRGARAAKVAEASERAIADYNALRARLGWDTAFVAALVTAGAWGFGTPSSAVSAAIGGLGALAYVFLLSRGVERIADGAKTGASGADDGQGARIALLALLVVLVGRSGGRLQLLPAIFGFFSYKLAVLLPLVSGEAFEE